MKSIKNMKRLFCLLMLAMLSIALLAGCGNKGNSGNSGNSSNSGNSGNSGSSGRKWRDTDVIDDHGTVTRNGMQIDVCVCHDQKAVYLYYDDEEHELFDTAKLPTDEFYDDDKDWLLGRISFSDITGDNNDDLEVYISHSDMSESHIVWTWEKDAGYVYKPDSSWFYHSIVVDDPPSDDSVNEFSMYEGVWTSDEDNQYDYQYIEFDGEGNWLLYFDRDVQDEGYLYVSEEDGTYGTYVHSNQAGAIDGGYIKLEGDRLYINTIGYFSRFVPETGSYSDDDGGDGGHGEDSELYQQNISGFQGVWYYDNDLSAETYIIIDGYGNWSYFQRVSGDAEGTKIDYGTLSYSADGGSTYYADSAMYSDVQYMVIDFDKDMLVWGDEGSYYRLEDFQ